METKQIQNFLNSYSVKMIIVMGLAIVLLIPSILIQELIRERITLSEQVKQELYAQWGGKQVVAGPVLNMVQGQMQLPQRQMRIFSFELMDKLFHPI